MKKWIFLICPVAMLGLFLVFYTADRKRHDETEAAYKVAQEKKVADKKAADEAIREKNRKDQAEKEAKKLADERDKEAKKAADAAKEKPIKAEVIAVGPGKPLDDGQLRALTVKVGDQVLVGKYAGTEVKYEGKEYKILKESEILAKLV